MSDAPAVVLRARTDDDLDLLFTLAAELDTWEERNPSAPQLLTRAQFDARQARLAESDTTADDASFVVEVDGQAVGTASLFFVDWFARHAEVGIALVAAARGRGIGTAAVNQLVEFAFVRRNLRRVHLQAVATNTAAIRAYEKAGFVHEGRMREHAWIRGTYEDVVLMARLRS